VDVCSSLGRDTVANGMRSVLGPECQLLCVSHCGA
jgi:hypothetical protein